MKIALKDFIDTDCVALDDGIRLYKEVFPELKEKRSVELDFSGVQTLFSPFLMGFIGKLLDHFEQEVLLQRLIFSNIAADHLKTMNEFIDRAENRLTEKTDLESMKEFFGEDELDVGE